MSGFPSANFRLGRGQGTLLRLCIKGDAVSAALYGTDRSREIAVTMCRVGDVRRMQGALQLGQTASTGGGDALQAMCEWMAAHGASVAVTP
ncbi:hypothetical protein XAC301_11290 [Xanthomonas arboricola pv. corylina]|uniref:Pyridine nucleotide-disulfide oxidoreductase n=1 Tax=Xanthomonas arboricola pv. corylina TaxID=487821 RepID=A0ABM8R289_9XANT|nr:hypothetical protein XAC301_11290 [Xanthomonas arboricola pv. corylina]CAE6728966.1 hypothetical protein XAC301_11290 [Xanthomonas arboricola pv. corylina]